VRFSTGLLAFLVVLEAVSLVGWLALPFSSLFPNGQWKEAMLSFLGIETRLFFSLQQLTPILLAVLLVTGCIGLLKPVIGFLRKHLRLMVKLDNGKKGTECVLAGLRSSLDEAFEPARTRSRRWMLVLAFSIIVVSCVTVYPYSPSLNPNGRLTGADVSIYVKWLVEIDTRGTANVFPQAFFYLPSRSLSVVLMYLGWKASGVPVGLFFQLLPLSLGLILVLATFFFAHKAGLNLWAGSLVSLFTAFSFHLTVGMFGGFFSNWVALIFLYLAWGFLFWSLKGNSWSLLGAATFLQVGVLFAHMETWEMTIGIGAVFFLIALARSMASKGGFLETKMMFVFLAANVAAAVARSVALRNSVSFVEAAQLSQAHLSWAFAGDFWRNLNVTLQMEMGISFVNPLMLFLACVGALVLALDDRLVSRFLNACALAATVPFIFGDWVIQTRVLYDLPTQIFACLGLLAALKLTGNLLGKSNEAARIKGLLFLAVVLVEVNYALRCSFNLV
jgi:hypothetical protein